MTARFLILFAFLLAAPAAAQNFPELTGRVVDQANLLNPQQEAELTNRLAALEQASTRQLVVVTIPSLEGHEIADYGYQLGRRWGIGQRGANNGALLIVAVSDRKIRIEVGYGLEGILTDALSDQIIREQIRPRFRADDYPGGINAGADAIIQQLQAPPEAAEARVQAAMAAEEDSDGGALFPIIFWFVVVGAIVISMMVSRGGRGRKYRGRRGPVIIWGSGLGNSGSSGWSGGGSWGGGSSSWGGGGGGGFSGGGGSFGGGGASGGW